MSFLHLKNSLVEYRPSGGIYFLIFCHGWFQKRVFLDDFFYNFMEKRRKIICVV